ncbi:MAG: hypothetical protein H6Q72_1318 [Firmicutes bacterium]|nr:hypothetical protein [Bacillota bacterium]
MKKGLIIGLAVLVGVLGTSWAFAESQSQDMKMGNMTEMHKKMVAQHVKDGVLTPEQAKAMDEHMANMGPMMNSMMSNGGMMGDNANCHSNQQNTNSVPQQ